MPTLARLNNPSHGVANIELAHNRDIDTYVETADLAFFVLGEDAHKKHGVNYDHGEMLIYSPRFKPEIQGIDLDHPTVWVAQTVDFDFSTL